MDIKDFLRHRLQVLNMSLSDLETRLNLHGYKVTKSAIGHWVTGRTIPPLRDKHFVDLLARALEMGPSEMLEEMGLIDTEADWSPTVQRIANIVNNFPPDKQRLALKLVEQLE